MHEVDLRFDPAEALSAAGAGGLAYAVVVVSCLGYSLKAAGIRHLSASAAMAYQAVRDEGRGAWRRRILSFFFVKLLPSWLPPRKIGRPSMTNLFDLRTKRD